MSGLDEASCPGRWPYPNFFVVFLSSSLATYRFLLGVTHNLSFCTLLGVPRRHNTGPPTSPLAEGARDRPEDAL